MRHPMLIILLLVLAGAASPAFAAHTFSVSGKVVDGLWQPVEGANVTLLDTNGRAFAEAATGTDGNYNFNDLPADIEVYTVKVSYLHGNVTYLAPAGGTRWFRALPESTIDPAVTQLIGYYPSHLGYVRGQAILFDNPGKKVNVTVHVGTISAMDTKDGSFVFGVPTGIYDVWASYDTPRGRYVSDTTKVTVVEMDSIQEATPITLELKREGITISDPVALFISLIVGLACLGGIYFILKKL